MSKWAINGALWAEMSEAQKIDSIRDGHASLKEIVAGLLDGPENLREACREFLAHTDASFAKLRVQINTDRALIAEELPTAPESDGAIEDLIPDYPVGALIENVRKRRLGLPKDYVPRPHRH